MQSTIDYLPTVEDSFHDDVPPHHFEHSLDKYFWKDPYCTDLMVNIMLIDNNDVQVNRTIFFAESGGQESDEGSIGGISVRYAKKQQHNIIYSLSELPPWKIGEYVLMKINGKRRARLRRLHFAAELVLEILQQHFIDHPIKKIGAHISAEKARIDFYWHDNIAKLFPDIQQKLRPLIAADYPIISRFTDTRQEQRYWQIKGFARVACGGTHPRRSSEIGEISLKRKNIGKNKERIEIYLCHP